MTRSSAVVLILSAILIVSCNKKDSNRDVAIHLVKAEYGDVRLNFDSAKLDSLYSISPRAYADSLKKGKELDEQLAALEGDIEHLPQSSSDSVGRISAKMTKQRYRLLELQKEKPEFVGWKLTNIRVLGEAPKTLDVNFDKKVNHIMK